MNQDQDVKYLLALTPDQLNVVSRACEFYARVLLGQFKEISFEITMQSIKDPLACEKRDAADDHLLMARSVLYPELFGWGHSYGIGHSKRADEAFIVHQVLRYTRAWHCNPEGGITVDFGPPYPAHDIPIPECKVMDGTTKIDDLAPVVHCRDCIFWQSNDPKKRSGRCPNVEGYFAADHFCSDGVNMNLEAKECR